MPGFEDFEFVIEKTIRLIRREGRRTFADDCESVITAIKNGCREQDEIADETELDLPAVRKALKFLVESGKLQIKARRQADGAGRPKWHYFCL